MEASLLEKKMISQLREKDQGAGRVPTVIGWNTEVKSIQQAGEQWELHWGLAWTCFAKFENKTFLTVSTFPRKLMSKL